VRPGGGGRGGCGCGGGGGGGDRGGGGSGGGGEGRILGAADSWRCLRGGARGRRGLPVWESTALVRKFLNGKEFEAVGSFSFQYKNGTKKSSE
jgi:hypothetical protein